MDWSPKEISVIVADYFKMLLAELSHLNYSESSLKKELPGKLLDRSQASIELMHQNISGVLAEMGLPYIKQYKPLFNYQELLADEVSNYLNTNKTSLESAFNRFSEETVLHQPANKIDFSSFLDNEPERSEPTESEPRIRPIKTNYLEKEQNNRTLGAGGEELVVLYEKWRLKAEHKENLAAKVKWVSKEKGDGLGFDIISKNSNGTDRYIEVKTTKLAKETPIYLSRNELLFASVKGRDFFLYRVFDFADKPKLFVKQGSYEEFCTVRPQTFKGYF
jgi:hypothetical protein